MLLQYHNAFNETGGANRDYQAFSKEHEVAEILVRAGRACEVLRQDPLIKEAFKILEEQLPHKYSYHCLRHSEWVMHKAVALALVEGWSPEQTRLVAIAAAWHDVGYIKQEKQNEVIAADMCAEALARRGFSNGEIAMVTRAILDTQVHPIVNYGTVEQRSTSYFSNVLLDADLSNIGSPEFEQWSLMFFAEQTGIEVPSFVELLKHEGGLAFLRGTQKLFEHNEWKTAASYRLFEGIKSEQMNRLERLCGLLQN